MCGVIAKQANQGGRWARGRRAAHPATELGRSDTDAGRGTEARPLGSMNGDDDGGGRGGGGDAPRATLQHIPDDEMMKTQTTFWGKFGQAVNQVPFAHSRWRLTCTVTALAVEWFIRIDRESCTVPSSSQNRHFEPRPKALPQLSVRWRRPLWRSYVRPLRLTRHGFVLRGHTLRT